MLHSVHAFAQAVVSRSQFESVTIVLIAANCVTLAMFQPLAPDNSPLNLTLSAIELAFNAAFTLEMLLRIIALGGLRGYLSSGWNLFDCIMVLAGYTQFLPLGGSGASGIRALRAMRALRPLRTITQFASLRSIVVCFMEAVPLLVSVVGMLFFLMFVRSSPPLLGDKVERMLFLGRQVLN